MEKKEKYAKKMAMFVENAKKIKEAADQKKKEQARAEIKQIQKQIYEKLSAHLLTFFKDKKVQNQESLETSKPPRGGINDTFGQEVQQPALSSRSSQKTAQQKRDEKFAALISQFEDEKKKISNALGQKIVESMKKTQNQINDNN